jgi:hypothetical protein
MAIKLNCGVVKMTATPKGDDVMDWTETYESSINRNLNLDKYLTLWANEPMNSLSDRYAFIPTMHVVNVLKEANWFPVSVYEGWTRKKSKRGFQKHMVRFRNKEIGLVDKSEGIFPELVFTNSHDGLVQANIHVGFERFVCTNKMSVSEGVSMSFTVKHLSDAYSHILNAAETVSDSIPAIGDSIREYMNTYLDSNQRFDYARKAVECKYDDEFLDSHYIDHTKLLEPKRHADKGNTLWKTFNVVQEKMLTGGVITLQKKGKIDVKTGERKLARLERSRAIKSVTENVRLNKSLWALTEEFYQEERLNGKSTN